MRKLLLLISLAATLFGACTGSSKTTSGGAEEEESKIVEASVPGEATLSFGDEKVTTRIKGVSMRAEAIPGNEFTKADEGKIYMIFDVEMENVGQKDFDLGGGFRLKLPDGSIENPGFTGVDSDEALGIGTTLTPGSKRAGTVSWEIPQPQPGQKLVVLWKPSGIYANQAQFTYEHK